MGTFERLLSHGGTIDIRVDYYSAEHAALLARYPEANTIRAIEGQLLSVSAAEFLTYCLFLDKSENLLGLRSYREIKAGLNEWLTGFELGLERTDRSLRTRLIGNDQIDRLSEKIGVGVALSVANKIHGLSEADWSKIPIAAGKTLDFEFACTNSGYVTIEAKGASIADNRIRESFYVKAADIKAKKGALSRSQTQYQVSAYGTIAAIDQRTDSVIQCWLLDPPARDFRRDPRQQRILNRLRFVAAAYEVILPHSIITVELYKRISLIADSDDVLMFDKHPLAKEAAGREQTIFSTNSHDLDRKFFGVTISLKNGSRFFYGIRREWLTAVHEQNFDALLDLSWPPETKLVTLALREAIETKQQGTGPLEQSAEATKKQRFKSVTAYLSTTSSGRAFGFIGPLERSHEHTTIDE